MADLKKIMQQIAEENKVDYAVIKEIEKIAKTYDGNTQEHKGQRDKQIERILNRMIKE